MESSGATRPHADSAVWAFPARAFQAAANRARPTVDQTGPAWPNYRWI